MYSPPPPRRRRDVLWWVGVSGAALMIGIALVVVGLAAWFVIALARPDSFGGDTSPHLIGEQEATTALADREVVVPEQFSFSTMKVWPVFTGANSYAGRYSFTTSDLDAAARLINDHNPGFAPLRAGTCDQRVVSDTVFNSWSHVGFVCSTDTQNLVTSRPTGDDSAGHDTGIPASGEGILLTTENGIVTLYVQLNGH